MLFGCFGELNDIVLVVVFFVLDDVCWMIGEYFVVSGGLN